MSEADWESFKNLRLAALQRDPDAFGSTYEKESDWSDHRWRDWAWKSEYRATEYTLYLACDGPRTLGMVGGVTTEGMAWIISMWVAPEARGRGIGRALVEAAMEWAADIGQERVGLLVETDNAPAMGLYRRLGFEPTGHTEPLASNPDKTVTRLERALP